MVGGTVPPVVMLFGPTASGKSALAMGLAEALGGDIINADSRQVYSGMQVLTAGPSVAEIARVPHHLFGYVDPRERISAGQWACRALACVADVRRRGNVPIVVGGTGFYLKTLLEGVSPVPEVPDDLTESLSQWAVPTLQAAVAQVDPALWHRMNGTAEAGNRQRLARALAVAQHTGQALSVWQAQPRRPGVPGPVVRLALLPHKEVQEARIRARWREPEAAGKVLAEVRALRAAGYTLADPGLQALAVAPFMAHVDGAVTLDEAVAGLIRADIAYTKRQRTWLRTQYRADMVWKTPDVTAALTWLRERGMV